MIAAARPALRSAGAPLAAVAAALLVVAVTAGFTHRVWTSEGQRLDALQAQTLEREAELALWRIEQNAAAVAAEPVLWRLDDPPAVLERSPWVRQAGVLNAAGNADAADDARWLETRLPATPAPDAALAALDNPFGAGDGGAPFGGGDGGDPFGGGFDQRNTANMQQQEFQQAALNPRGAVERDAYSRVLPRLDGGRLLLLRRVDRGPDRWIQRVELDVPAVTRHLRGAIGPALPHARVQLLAEDDAAPPRRRVAALPFFLDPGPAAPGPGRAGLARLLLAGWAALFAALALGASALVSLVRLSRRRAAFVSAVTHEMRTPLTTFRMYTDLLADGVVTDPAQRQSYLDTLRAQSVRLAALVENVLAFARLERQSAVPLETTTPAALVERCLPRLGERAALDGMTLSWTPGDADDTHVRAAPALVEQILFNLVDNACKYAGGGDDKAIAITATADDRHAHLTLRDHGPGVQETEGQLFKPFTRSAEREAAASPGVGLGLALGRRMARAMGGDLRLVNQAAGESGASFRLTLRR